MDGTSQKQLRYVTIMDQPVFSVYEGIVESTGKTYTSINFENSILKFYFPLWSRYITYNGIYFNYNSRFRYKNNKYSYTFLHHSFFFVCVSKISYLNTIRYVNSVRLNIYVFIFLE